MLVPYNNVGTVVWYNMLPGQFMRLLLFLSANWNWILWDQPTHPHRQILVENTWIIGSRDIKGWQYRWPGEMIKHPPSISYVRKYIQAQIMKCYFIFFVTKSIPPFWEVGHCERTLTSLRTSLALLIRWFIFPQTFPNSWYVIKYLTGKSCILSTDFSVTKGFLFISSFSFCVFVNTL